MSSVAFVTHQPLAIAAGGLLSDLAPIRRELVLPALALRSVGRNASVVSLRGMTTSHLREALHDATHVVFGRVFPGPDKDAGRLFSADIDAYARALGQMPSEHRACFYLSEDGLESPASADFYKSLETRAQSWLVSSESLRPRVESFSSRRVVVCPEPAEMQRREPRVPRRGWRARLGAALARRARVGLEPWRIRVLWFGDRAGVPSLLAARPELDALSREVPLHLECVSQEVPELTTMATRRGAEFSAPLRISFTPWSIDATQAALERCDAVLLPQPDGPMIDSLHAGRFVVAHPLPAYQELREYAWVGDSMTEGLRWLLRHPDEALERVRRGQDYVSENHSMQAIGGFWQVTLGLRAT